MSPMNAILTGGLAGLTGAVGILSVISALRRRRPTLMARLEPYVHRQPTTSGLLAGAVVSIIAYRLMLRLGRLPEEERMLR